MKSCVKILTSSLMILLVFLLLVCSQKGDTNDNSTDARVYMSIGTVSVNKLINPKKGDLILAGDVIETGNDGICEIMMGPHTFLRVNNGTVIIYNISSSSNFIQLRKGAIAGITKKAFPRDYNITTNTLIAGIHESSFFIQAENPNSTYVCLCKGKINLHPRGAISGDEVTATGHSATRFMLNEKGEPGVDKNPGHLYHADALFQEMERKIVDRGI